MTMINLVKLAGYPLRWLLAFLLALPTSLALYQVVRPQSITDMQVQMVYDMMDQLQRLASTMGVSASSSPRPALDWGLIILLVAAGFTVYSAFLHGWRALPMVAMLAIPVFEGMRFYQPGALYTAETAWAWWALHLLTAPLVLGFLVVVAVWRLFIYGRMVARVGWRWTAALAAVAIAGVGAVRFFTPLRALFEIETSAHPGSAWLATLMISWAGLVWLRWKVKRWSDKRVRRAEHGVTMGKVTLQTGNSSYRNKTEADAYYRKS
jgi:hypothetical protein